ncbi:MAG: Ig-like domain repeat protein, partial [Acidimicrobiales bacterium]
MTVAALVALTVKPSGRARLDRSAWKSRVRSWTRPPTGGRAVMSLLVVVVAVVSITLALGIPAAQATGCDVATPTYSFINFPSYADTDAEICGMYALEDFSYEMYAEIHGYPSGDPRIAQTGAYEIVGYAEGMLEQIAYLEANDPSVLTADEVGAYDWNQAIDETYQVRAAQDALNEYNKWHTQQCTYVNPDSTLFTYDPMDQSICEPGGSSSLGVLFDTLSPPSYQEFLNYGTYEADQEMGVTNAITGLSDQEYIEDGIVGGIGAATAIIGAAAPQILDALGVGGDAFASFLNAVQPFAGPGAKRALDRQKLNLRTNQVAKETAQETELESTGESDPELVTATEESGVTVEDAGIDVGAEVAAEGADALSGPLAIVAIGATIAVEEGIKVFTEAAIPGQLQDNLTLAQNAAAATDVENLIGDPTGAGYTINLQNFENQLNLPAVTIGNSTVYTQPPTPSANQGTQIKVTALKPDGTPSSWTWTAPAVENIDTWPLGVDEGAYGPPEQSISILNGVAWTKQQAGSQATDATHDGLTGYLPSGGINFFNSAGTPETAFVDGNQFNTLTGTGSIDAGGQDAGDNCATAGECTLSNSIVVMGLGGTPQLEDHATPTISVFGLTCNANDPGTHDCFSDTLLPDGNLVPATGLSKYVLSTGEVGTQTGTGQLFRLTIVPDAGTPASIYPVTNQYNSLANDSYAGAPDGGFVAGQTATFQDWGTNKLGYSTTYTWQIESKCAYDATKSPETIQGVPVCPSNSTDYGKSSLASNEQDLSSCTTGSPLFCLDWTEDSAFHNDPVTTLTGDKVDFTWPAAGTYHVRLITTDEQGKTNQADEDIVVSNPATPSATFSFSAASGTQPVANLSAIGPVHDGVPFTVTGCVDSADFQGSSAYSTPDVTVGWGDGTSADSAIAGSTSDPNLVFTYAPTSGCSTPWEFAATHTYNVTVPGSIPYFQRPLTVTVGDVTDPATAGSLSGNSRATSYTYHLGANIYPTTSAPGFVNGANDSTTFTVGTTGYFTGYVTGDPNSTISDAAASGVTENGVSCTAGLPGGIGFVASTATNTFVINGAPSVSEAGCWAITITASNGNSPNATQTFILNVDRAPAITSGSTAGWSTGSSASFTVSTTGFPTPALSISGTSLPADISFVDNGDGTATLSSLGANIAASDSGTYNFTVAAKSAAGTTSQAFTLTIGGLPVFTSGTTAGYATLNGVTTNFDITTGGYPATTSISCSISISGSPTACNGSAAYSCLNSYVDNTSPGNPFPGKGLFLADSSGVTPLTCSGGVSTVTTSSAKLVGAAANPGEYDLTITATNAIGSTTETLSVFVSPTGGPTIDFVSSLLDPSSYCSPGTCGVALGSATFTVGSARSVVACSNDAADSLYTDFALPAGVTVTQDAILNTACPSDANKESATISGTPSTTLLPDSTGIFNPTSTGSVVDSGGGLARLNIYLQGPPTISSPSTTTFTEGQHGSFTVDLGTLTSTGGHGCLAESDSLPAGLTFVDNGNNTATLSGTPTATGQYSVTVTPSDCATTNGTPQTLTVDVNSPPSFTSAASRSFGVDAGGSFTVTTNASAYPIPALTVAGLPSGVTFTDNGDGTGTLEVSSAAPATTTAASLALTATSSAGTATQSFSLAIGTAPEFTSLASDTATFVAGDLSTYTFSATGEPTPALTCTISGTTCSVANLPAGLTFTDNGDGTATLAGTPTATGTTTLTVTASDGVGSSATSTLAVSVDTTPAFTGTSQTASCTSPSGSTSDTLQADSAGTWTLCASGSPSPSITLISVTCSASPSSLPAELTFTDNGDGSATVAGTPDNGSGAACATGYVLNVAIANGAATVTQSVTLNIDDVILPTSSPDAPTFVAGIYNTYDVTASAIPTAAFAVDGSTPISTYPWLTFTDNGDGTATLSGTPPAGAVATQVNLTIDETNGTAAPVSDAVTITITPFAITSSFAQTDTLPVASIGEPYPYSFTASASATFALASGFSLPTGLTLSPSGTISGIPTELGRFPISLSVTSGADTVTTSTVNLVVGVGAHALEISQFRSFGPAGLSDWFVQVYNTTSSSIPLSGWNVGILSLTASCSPTPCSPSATLVSLGSGTLAPGATAVVSGPSYSLDTRMPPAATGPMLVALPGGFEVVAPNGTVTDVAGESTAPSAYVAGAGAAFPATIDVTAQDAFVRGGYTLTSTSPPADTDDNATDFTYGPVIAPTLPSSTGLDSSGNPSTVGQSVTLTATVTGYSPTGSVEFKDGGNAISGCGAQTLSSGTATCTTSSLSTGSNSITAVYGG